MTARKRIALLGGALVLGCAFMAGKLVHEINQKSIVGLLTCVETPPAPLAWTCKQVLENKLRQPENVAQLNAQGGGLYPVLLADPSAAREMMALFVQYGVDVNARERDLPAGWTALHIVATDTNLWPVQVLLEYGANPDAADASGMTPLDRAREAQERHPSPERESIIRLLESRQAARQ